MDEEDTEIIAKRAAETDNTAKTTPPTKPTSDTESGENGAMPAGPEGRAPDGLWVLLAQDASV